MQISAEPPCLLAGQLARLTDSQALSLDFQAADKLAANELAQVVGTVGSESSQDLARLPLDHTGLPGCGDACVEESLKVRPTLMSTHNPDAKVAYQKLCTLAGLAPSARYRGPRLAAGSCCLSRTMPETIP